MDLLDYGYNQYEAELVYKKGSIIGKTKIDKGNVDEIDLVASNDVINIKKKIDEKKEYKYDIKVDNISLPIKKGTKVATLYIKDNNTIINKVDLLTAKDIKKQSFINLYLNTIKNVLLGRA